MSSTLDKAREILASLAPEIPEDEITKDADLKENLRLDPVTIYALAVNLERALKIQIPDSQIESARTIADLAADETVGS